MVRIVGGAEALQVRFYQEGCVLIESKISVLWCQGNTHLSVNTYRFIVDDIFEHSVVIYSDSDNFHSQPVENAGKKNTCGVIKGHDNKE